MADAPRINRCIELYQSGEPLYYTGMSERLTYERGRELAGTWADFILVEFEHHGLDTRGLVDFMQGLRDAGPAPSGQRTPTVLCTLPVNGTTEAEVHANAWQIRHILATGVHGLVLCHARTPEAVRAFVEAVRYPTSRLGVGEGLGEGTRGMGGQGVAAEIWGLDPMEYVRKADPWPLNPEGELLLGLKIEDRHGMKRAFEITAVPGLFFSEWGPGDMGVSHGHPDWHDPPYAPEMDHARLTIQAACEAEGLAFLCSWADPDMDDEARARHLLHDVGARILSGGEEVARIGRQITGRPTA